MSLSLTIESIALLAAVGGYGDVGSTGLPTYAERQVHMYINEARIYPIGFQSEYSTNGCSYYSDFNTTEQTGQIPLYMNDALLQSAQAHSQDMAANKEATHDSSDGTSMEDRLAAIYAGTVAEAIAAGYEDAYTTVFGAWMCDLVDEGTRATIMNPEIYELGTGAEADYYTADFGGNPSLFTSPVRMALHEPEVPTDEADFTVDWSDTERPASILVVLDGEQKSTTLLMGIETLGVYGVTATLPAIDDDCHEYYVRWTKNDQTKGYFPEEGSYLFGQDCAEAVLWKEGRAGEGKPLTEDELLADVQLSGCASLPGTGAGAGGALLALAALLARRKRA
jgi:hypothetical protein